MPHHKSAEKRLKTNEKSRRRNVAAKSLLRKQLKAQKAKDGDAAKAGVSATYSALDRAARKRFIPTARANRLKSRLAKRAARTPAAS